jgi:hypothetical protein
MSIQPCSHPAGVAAHSAARWVDTASPGVDPPPLQSKGTAAADAALLPSMLLEDRNDLPNLPGTLKWFQEGQWRALLQSALHQERERHPSLTRIYCGQSSEGVASGAADAARRSESCLPRTDQHDGLGAAAGEATRERLLAKHPSRDMRRTKPASGSTGTRLDPEQDE